MLGSIVRLRRQVRVSLNYMRIFRSFEFERYEVLHTEDKALIDAAKKLHAATYLRRGFVLPSDIIGDKLSHRTDPHQHHSHYFVVIDKKTGLISGTARQIRAHRTQGHYSFPLFTQAQLYKYSRDYIEKFKPKECVEISGLVKHKSADSMVPLLLYRALWHYSLRNNHKIWLMACDVRLYERLQLLFGSAIRRAGKTTPYQGGDVVPAIVDIQSSVSALKRSLRSMSWFKWRIRRQIVDFFLHGAPYEIMSAEEKRAFQKLKHG
jgi:hypothetical protein